MRSQSITRLFQNAWSFFIEKLKIVQNWRDVFWIEVKLLLIFFRLAARFLKVTEQLSLFEYFFDPSGWQTVRLKLSPKIMYSEKRKTHIKAEKLDKRCLRWFKFQHESRKSGFSFPLCRKLWNWKQRFKNFRWKLCCSWSISVSSCDLFRRSLLLHRQHFERKLHFNSSALCFKYNSCVRSSCIKFCSIFISNLQKGQVACGSWNQHLVLWRFFCQHQQVNSTRKLHWTFVWLDGRFGKGFGKRHRASIAGKATKVHEIDSTYQTFDERGQKTQECHNIWLGKSLDKRSILWQP